MSGVTKLMTAGGGGVALTPASSIASDVTVNVPSVNCTLYGNAGTTITSGTAVASTSGTSIDFTGIPSWVKRITVMLSGVSTNGSSVLQVQIGSGSLTTSGYLGSVSLNVNAAAVTAAPMSSGHFITTTQDAGSVVHGKITVELLGSNKYVFSGIVGFSNGAAAAFSGSSISLSDAMDRISISPFNGTDTFDAGSINILYE